MKLAFKTFACGAVLGLSTFGNTQEGVDLMLEETTVIGTDQSRYLTSARGTLAGFSLDFLELPRVINVIPEQLVLDQKITDLNEALRNTPGVTQSDGFGGTNDDFLIRGFRRNVVYRDGFRRASNFKTNLSNTDSIQIIRGPASITYGQVEPGGLVDIITKKALDERRIAGEARAASFNSRLLLLDWSEPLGDKGGLRAVGSTEDAESFREFTEIARDTVALSGQFDFTEAMRLNVSYEYRDESRPLDRGTLTLATPTGREVINRLIDIPIARRFGEPFEVFESEFRFLDANLDQDLGADWTLRLSAAREESLANDIQARPRAVVILNEGAPITEDGFFLAPVMPEARFDDPTDQVFLARRSDGSRERNIEVTYLNAVVSGELDTGSINHRVAFGADYRSLDTSRFFVTTPTTNGVPEEFGGNGPLLNLRNPVYGRLPATLATENTPLQEQGSTDLGLFINDYMALTETLSLLIGVRYDEVEFDGALQLDAADSLSPQIALNQKLSDRVSIFASYSEAFEPNTLADPEAGPLEPIDPEESDQIELGLKTELFEGKLQTAAALYRIEKTNVLTSENGIPVLRDGQSSEGVELSVSGQPVDGMNVLAGYAYTDAALASSDMAGNRPRNVGENTFNIWTSYEWQTGRLEGWGLGGGVFYISDRFGDDSNTFRLDAYTLVDLSTWYTLQIPGGNGYRTLRFQLAAKNLFDEEYFPASGGNERISIGTPRSIFGSVSFDF